MATTNFCGSLSHNKKPNILKSLELKLYSLSNSDLKQKFGAFLPSLLLSGSDASSSMQQSHFVTNAILFSAYFRFIVESDANYATYTVTQAALLKTGGNFLISEKQGLFV